MGWKEVRLGDILTESKIESTSPGVDSRIRVLLNAKGVIKRPAKKETKGATKYFIRKNGQFIYGKQNIHKGAFGIVPDDLDGFESTSDLPAFDVDEGCLPIWIDYYLKQGNFYLDLVNIARGAATQRVQPKELFELEIPLPPLDEQRKIVAHFKSVETEDTELKTELTHQQTLLKKLRQQILQEAIEGKLTADWREQNPNVEPASELLKRIQAEKAQLIKDKKIKKQKPLPPTRLPDGQVSEDEKPFALPDGWVWCRLEEVLYDLQYGTSKKCTYDVGQNTPILRIPNISSGLICSKDLKYTDLTDKEKNQYSLLEGDLLVIRSNGSKKLVGKTVCVSNEFEGFGYAGYLIRLRFSLSKSNIHYLQKYLGSWALREQIETPLRTTVGINNINSTELSNLLIPLPPLPEQKAIVTKVEKLLALCDQLETQITHNQTHANALMQAVLKEAFTIEATEPAAANA
ncbi:MAG: restriction endonuclease subunit S [Candidatus Endonucleobacter bathymodioli]|uniref:Restriction endonuclease subunit S n=1 Tax=Candidatus Endonucleibacter bathymodioli TaxID=539814 RepID=A0AA90SWN6_9GAMM|nr:restriction endonuclease subunit S [Candidatus Endonucleobacter bathymodioli]